MGDPRPHGGPAEERDGDPQHNHRGPPPEGLGALHGPEECHHIRRSAKKMDAWSNCCKRAPVLHIYLTRIWLFPKGTIPCFGLFHQAKCST